MSLVVGMLVWDFAGISNLDYPVVLLWGDRFYFIAVMHNFFLAADNCDCNM
jgi:hypothetical protein